MSRIVIYGGGGFVGRYLANAFADQGREVIVFGRAAVGQTQTDADIPLNPQVRRVQGDFADTTAAVSILHPGDTVFDLVALSVPFTSMLSPVSEVKEHIFPHVQFIEAAYQKDVQKIVFTSSGGAVYGDSCDVPFRESDSPDPVSPYAISKLTIEHFLTYFARSYDKEYVIYRLSNPYGPGQKMKKGFGLIPTLFSSVLHQQAPIFFGNGKLVRDYIYIEDVITAILASVDKQHRHQLYNIGSGIGVSTKELWQIIQHLTATTVQPELGPQRFIDPTKVCLDISRMRSEFGWLPKTSLEDGLAKTWRTVVSKNGIISS